MQHLFEEYLVFLLAMMATVVVILIVNLGVNTILRMPTRPLISEPHAQAEDIKQGPTVPVQRARVEPEAEQSRYTNTSQPGNSGGNDEKEAEPQAVPESELQNPGSPQGNKTLESDKDTTPSPSLCPSTPVQRSPDTDQDVRPEGFETPQKEGDEPWEEANEDEDTESLETPTKAERRAKLRRQYWKKVGNLDIKEPDRYSDGLNPVETQPLNPPATTDMAYQHHRCPPPEPWERREKSWPVYYHSSDNIFGVHGPIDRPIYVFDDPFGRRTVPYRCYVIRGGLRIPYRIPDDEMLRGMEPHLYIHRCKREDECEQQVRYAYDPGSQRMHRIYPPYPDITDAERRLRLECPSLRHTTNIRTNPFTPSKEPWRMQMVGNQVNWVPDPHIFEENPRKVDLPPPLPPKVDERKIRTSNPSATCSPFEREDFLQVRCEGHVQRSGQTKRCSRTWYLTLRGIMSPERFGPHRCRDHAYNRHMQSATLTELPAMSGSKTWLESENPLPGIIPYNGKRTALFAKQTFEQAKTLAGWVYLTDEQRSHALHFYDIRKAPRQLLEPYELRRLEWSQKDINNYYYLLDTEGIKIPEEVKAYRAYHLRVKHDNPWEPDITDLELRDYKRALGIPNSNPPPE